MMDPPSLLAIRCAALARSIAAEEHWVLEQDQVGLLVTLAVQHLPNLCTDVQICNVLKNIQQDHLIVEALRQQDAPGHAEEWVNWVGQTQAILCHAGLDWTSDDAVDYDDLTQIALLELARSLPSYRYVSRFSTWAYQVITRGVQRHLRGLAAKKRAGAIDREIDPNNLLLIAREAEHPEHQAWSCFLTMLVDHELHTAFGCRNALVFQLWSRDDLSAEMISRKIGLSTARIYAIIALARGYLQSCTAIKQWKEVGIN